MVTTCLELLGRLIGIQTDVLTPEEAARLLLEREVTFKWQPQIVEVVPDTPYRTLPAATPAPAPTTLMARPASVRRALPRSRPQLPAFVQETR
jgi:hypothetical protein